MPCNISPPDFNPKTDIPPLDGKVIFITGGTHGLGKQSVLEFARYNPREIWLAARNTVKARTVAEEITQTVPGATIRILELDLASFASVVKAANTFLSACDRLDILMLNAGIMAVPPGTTTEGYEIQFGTNHMGHALLTKLLLPTLDKTVNTTAGADVRIVSVSSKGHHGRRPGRLRTLLPKQAGKRAVGETDGGAVSAVSGRGGSPGHRADPADGWSDSLSPRGAGVREGRLQAVDAGGEGGAKPTLGRCCTGRP